VFGFKLDRSTGPVVLPCASLKLKQSPEAFSGNFLSDKEQQYGNRYCEMVQ